MIKEPVQFTDLMINESYPVASDLWAACMCTERLGKCRGWYDNMWDLWCTYQISVLLLAATKSRYYPLWIHVSLGFMKNFSAIEGVHKHYRKKTKNTHNNYLGFDDPSMKLNGYLFVFLCKNINCDEQWEQIHECFYVFLNIWSILYR